MIKAVIFDLDGLLADTEMISYRIYQEILKTYDVGFSVEFYARNYSGKTEIHNLTDILSRFSIPLSIQEGIELVDKKEKEFIYQGVELKRGAKELIAYLHKNKIGIALATSSTADRANFILESNDVYKYFDAFVYGNEVKNGKPDPDIFLKCLGKLGLSVRECLVLEDSEAGVEAACRANIPVINIPDMKMIAEEYLNKTVCQYGGLEEVILFIEEENK